MRNKVGQTIAHSRLSAAALLVAALMSGCSKPKPKLVVPEVYDVAFDTTQGTFTVEVSRAWAPRGADRVYELVHMRDFDEGRFFRVLPGFIAQFGVHKDFKVHDVWRELSIIDDPRKQDNLRGTLAFAQSGPNTRATEVFINLADNKARDDQGLVPFGRIVSGMDVPDKLYSGYGELGPEGKGPASGRVEGAATKYLAPRFPQLAYLEPAQFGPRGE